MMVRFWQLLLLLLAISSLQAQTKLPVRISPSYNLVDKASGAKLFAKDYDILRRYGKTQLFIAARNGKYGLIDSEETLMLPFEYDHISFSSLSNRLTGLRIPYGIIEKDQRFGLLDSLGQLTTPIHFEKAPGIYTTKGGTTSIKGKYGFISPQGKVLIPFQYESPISLKGELAIVTKNGKKGVHQTLGKLIIPTEYDAILHHEELQILIVRKGQQEGVYQADGKLIVPIEYEDISATFTPSNQYYLVVQKNKKVGLTSFEGKQIIPIEYDHIDSNHPRGIIVKKDKLYGLVGTDGKTLIPTIYRHLDFAHSDEFNSEIESWRTLERGYVKLEEGTLFDTTAYDDYYNIVPYYILLKKGKKYRIADWYGDIKPGLYDKIDCNLNTRKCFVSNAGQYGLIDYQGNILIPLAYRGFRYLGFDYKYLQFWDEKYNLGIMNIDGITILPARYQHIKYSENFLQDPIYEDHLAFHVQFEDKWGLISNKEQWLIPPIYEHLGYFNKGLAPAKKGNLWGIINKDNQVVVPFQHQETRISKTGFVEVKIGQEWEQIDPIRKAENKK